MRKRWAERLALVRAFMASLRNRLGRYLEDYRLDVVILWTGVDNQSKLVSSSD